MANYKSKVMLIGVDGCSFNVLTPMIEQGKLPNFELLMKKGVYGDLRSTIPPISAAAWTTFQTGNGPGKHGIFDFFRNNPETYSYTAINSTYIKSETFWERLSRLGKSVGLINFLFTYPPKEINGFIISGKETPSKSSDYTYPDRIRDEILKAEPRYEVDPFKKLTQTKKFLANVPKHLKRQERVNSYLFNKYPTDLFMNMFAMPDVIQHAFWRYMDPAHPLFNKKEAKVYLPLIENVFQTLDEIIGNCIKNIDENTTLIIMSDHGGGGINRVVQLNRWLQDQHLLILKKTSIDGRQLFIRKVVQQLKRLDRYLGKYDIFAMRRQIKHATREKRRSLSKKTFIDWAGTKAYMGRIGEDGIYCNLKGREKHGIVSPGRQYEELRNYIISELRELRDPQNGQRVFKHVHKRENIYKGPFVKYAPDIILETAELPYQTGDDLFCDELFQDVSEYGLTGKHQPDGILIAYGKGIKKGHTIQGAHIGDLAPSILYVMGEKIPPDMDGKMLEDLFEEHILESCPVKYDNSTTLEYEAEERKFSQEETKEIEDRLKDLGYL